MRNKKIFIFHVDTLEFSEFYAFYKYDMVETFLPAVNSKYLLYI